MNISLISFTRKGGLLNKKLNNILINIGHKCESYSIDKYAKELDILSINNSLKDWTKNNFEEKEAIIFISATGIAVRSIAPFIKSKDLDPAVIVIDEGGKFVIPILSGHIGGANNLSKEISKEIKATEVITTATDINNSFAVDNFAVKNNLHICDVKKIKYISSKILDGEIIPLYTEYKVEGSLPKEISLSNKGDIGISISLSEKDIFKNTFNLIPKGITIGIGCKKGTPIENIEALVFSVLKENNISIHAVKMIASIDLKKEEQGIVEFCNKYNIKFNVYTAEELRSVKGDFTESSFVKSVTGVSNVCERAAVKGSNLGELIVRKQARNGVTVAIAKEDWSVSFE